jgi:hypothetical protein
MNRTLGISEIIDDFSILDEYDYVVIEDKQKHIKKGIFVSLKFLDEVKEFIESKKKTKNRVLDFVGNIEIDDRFLDKKAGEIKEMIAFEKYGK